SDEPTHRSDPAEPPLPRALVPRFHPCRTLLPVAVPESEGQPSRSPCAPWREQQRRRLRREIGQVPSENSFPESAIPSNSAAGESAPQSATGCGSRNHRKQTEKPSSFQFRKLEPFLTSPEISDCEHEISTVQAHPQRSLRREKYTSHVVHDFAAGWVRVNNAFAIQVQRTSADVRSVVEPQLRSAAAEIGVQFGFQMPGPINQLSLWAARKRAMLSLRPQPMSNLRLISYLLWVGTPILQAGVALL